MSTQSRLEAGQRRPNLELLLPIAKAHEIPLDELVGAPPTGALRVQLHWFGGVGPGPIEHLTLLGWQGERMHVRAEAKGA